MKYILLFCILFSSAWIAGCSSPTIPAVAEQPFFPVNEMVKWNYSTGNNGTVNCVWNADNNLTTIDATTYYTVVESYLSAPQHTDTVFYKQVGDVLYRRIRGSRDYVIADFSLQLNAVAWWDTSARVTVKDDNTITFATTFGADYGYSISFKRGVGIVSQIDNGFVYNQLTLVNYAKRAVAK